MPAGSQNQDLQQHPPAVFKASFLFSLGPPPPRGVAWEGPDGQFLWKIEGFGPVLVRIRGWCVFHFYFDLKCSWDPLDMVGGGVPYLC